MQSQMSGASAPSLVPQPAAPPAAPRLVQPSPRKPRKSRLPLIFLILLLVAGAAWYLRQSFVARQAEQAGGLAIRTVSVAKGSVDRTIRLTGTTGAERFVSLVTPQLRGNRGQGRGRDASSTSTASFAAPLVIASNARKGTGSTSSAVAGDGTSVSSTAGASAGTGSSAFQSATSRVSRGTTSSASSSPASTASSSTANSSTANGGLGSTSSQLGGTGFAQPGGGGGGGGGGGASEFSLVLQSAAKPGSHVKKGQVIAEFDRQYMINRLDDYRASVVQQEASLQKLRAELVMARKAYEQKLDGTKADLEKAQLDVKTTPVLGKIEAEKINLAAEEAEARHRQVLDEKKFVEIGYAAQLKNAEIDLETSRLELRRAEANADRMIIKAPINGLAVMQSIFRGSEFGQVQAGDQLWPGMMFMQVVDPSAMVVNATVNQVDVESLRIGQRAHVRFDAYPGLQLPAHIHSVGAMTRAGGQRASFVKEIPVVLKLDQMDPRVIPDLSVSADVVVESESNVSVAPQNAIFRDDSGSGSPYVFVKAGESWERRPVQLGVINNVSVAVRSGVHPGEVVALEAPPSGRSPADQKKEQT